MLIEAREIANALDLSQNPTRDCIFVSKIGRLRVWSSGKRH